ncbi:glycosyltransferase family 4 protein [Priestia aryabhattai]|uniref:glycosyltransferase family 4 protein n=1 Tax=Priestia aryabhattai TaxID=412384 RepID=UPI001EB0F29D|nr:glycosyltransferase family 4 protein [Priestia aryabhattai]MBY0091556.1 glycosyltransferase family 4 protein [Priestia aryabhattai]MBY0104180.1 glycosyltransferase family 4 protein [Priestia aryabhattai]
MKKIMVVGPIPPPIHGESLALDNLIKSDEINDSFTIKVINTNRKNVNSAGKFSINKFFQDIIIIYKIFREQADIMYISISQTKLGLLRDLLIINLSQKKSCKIVTHLHGNNLGNTIDSLTNLEKKLAKHVLSKVNSAIVLGERLVSNYRGMVNDVNVIRNGISEDYIDYNEFEVAMLEKKDKKTLKIIYLSNLIESKGFLIAAKAVIELIKEGYQIELILAGAVHDNEKYEELLKIIKENNCKEIIKYIGIVTGEKKKGLLLNADIMLLPTYYKVEGQPISIIEGMAAGLPIISTNIGCIDEMIKDNGFLLEDSTVPKVREALRKLIEDKNLRIECSYNSRNRFEKYYCLDKYISGIKNIFTSVLR